MNIVIRGMEMPTSCMDCPFMVSRDDDDCILQSAEANENFEDWEQMKAGCPLVPVPPHGRLIDAEELEQEIHKRFLICEKDGNHFQKPYEALRAIESAPTIIPAEESE